MEYTQQKKRAENNTPDRSSASAFGEFSGNIPNSTMLEMLDNQIPAAEEEADRLSAGVTASTPEALKEAMGERMGADFSNVEFHTGSDAAGRAESMGARAWTEGNDVYFGEGGFDPAVAAHELVHTAQQGAVEADTPTMDVESGTVQMWPKWLKKFGKLFHRKKGSQNPVQNPVQIPVENPVVHNAVDPAVTAFENTDMPIPDDKDYKGPDAIYDENTKFAQGSIGALTEDVDYDELDDTEEDEIPEAVNNAETLGNLSDSFYKVMNGVKDNGEIGEKPGRNARSRGMLNTTVNTAFTSLGSENVPAGGLSMADPAMHTSLVNQSARRLARLYGETGLSQEDARAVMAEEGKKYLSAMEDYKLSDDKKALREASDTKAYVDLAERLGGVDFKDKKSGSAIEDAVRQVQVPSRMRRDKERTWRPVEAANVARHGDTAANAKPIAEIIRLLGRTPTREEYLSMEKMTMEYPQWVKLLTQK